MAYTIHRPSDPPVRGTRALVPPIYPRFLRRRRTTHEPDKKNARWHWGTEEEQAFRTLKKALASAPILACPDFDRRFIIQTDASTTGLGAELTQHFEEGERVIAYASRTLNGDEKNYSATELECLAVMWGIRVGDSPFPRIPGGLPILRHHGPPSPPMIAKDRVPTGRLARWMLELQQYTFDVKYRRSKLNRVADALSRLPAVHAARSPRCPWYYRQLRRVRERPDEFPDYTVRQGKMYRHILHSTDFREVPADLQWK